MNRYRVWRGVVMAALVLVGLLNVVPGVSLLAPGRLSTLYGVDQLGAAETVLLRHRALLLGLVGAFMLLATVARSWRVPALASGLVSNLVYVALVATADTTKEIERVALIDLVVLPLLVAGLVGALRDRESIRVRAGAAR